MKFFIAIFFIFANHLIAAQPSEDLYLAHSTAVFPLPRMEIGGLSYNLATLKINVDCPCTRPTIHWTVLGIKPSRILDFKGKIAHDTLSSLAALMSKYVIIVPLSYLSSSIIAGTIGDIYCLGPLVIDPAQAILFAPIKETNMIASNYPNLKNLHGYKTKNWPDYDYIYSQLAINQIPHVVSNKMLIKYDESKLSEELITLSNNGDGNTTIPNRMTGQRYNADLVVHLSPKVIKNNKYFLIIGKEFKNIEIKNQSVSTASLNEALDGITLEVLHLHEDSMFAGLMDYYLILSDHKITTFLLEIKKYIDANLFTLTMHCYDLIPIEKALIKAVSSGVTSLEQLDNLFDELKKFEDRFKHDPREIIAKNMTIFLERACASLLLNNFSKGENMPWLQKIIYSYLDGDFNPNKLLNMPCPRQLECRPDSSINKKTLAVLALIIASLGYFYLETK